MTICQASFYVYRRRWHTTTSILTLKTISFPRLNLPPIKMSYSAVTVQVIIVITALKYQSTALLAKHLGI